LHTDAPSMPLDNSREETQIPLKTAQESMTAATEWMRIAFMRQHLSCGYIETTSNAARNSAGILPGRPLWRST
jgi:hypothetical protein